MRTLALALVSIVLLAGSALAATQDLTVSAKVIGTCQFTAKSNISFPDIYANSNADATAEGSLTFWCTKNATYDLTDEANSTVTDGSFTGTLSGATATDSIPYQLTYTNSSGSGAGKTSPITSVVTATILNADYVDAEADTYSDTVTFTVTP
jgi:spore coat protein U-like protein